MSAPLSMVGATRARGDVYLCVPGNRGCISIIWIRSALSLDEAVAQFVAPLRETAAAIALEG